MSDFNWVAISTLATIFTGIIALFSIIKKRNKIKIYLTNEGRFSDEKKAYIEITNHGKRTITINRILVKYCDDKVKELIQDFKLPKSVKQNDSLLIDSPHIAYHLNKIKDIYVTDSSGKKWKCNKKSMKLTNKIISNYIGKRFIYPSMGDKEDESL